MKNQVGREIPDEILARMGKTGYRGLHDRDNASYRKASPTVRALNDPQRGKLCASLHEALEKCELHDGMYFGFHHHFRDGDYVINMVMQEVARMGIRDITICATSMGAAHDALEPLIKQGVIAGIQSSGVRGKIGEAISKGKFKKPAVIRSHGGRVRAIEEGDIHLDVAFIGAPTADEYGNARAVGGKSDCGVLSYSMADAKYADRVVVITDCLVPFPNTPASISMTDVDYVCVVDEIGDPKKIVSNVVRVTKDVRELMMAEYCTQIIAQSPYFKDGFSFQTGGGGAALAVNGMLKPYMQQKGIRMGFAIGGIMQAMCDLMDEGFVRKIVDAQVFDAAAIEHIKTNPNHVEISTSEYANPMNKGAYVNKLDFVILGALEVERQRRDGVGRRGSRRARRPSGYGGGGQVRHRRRAADPKPNPDDCGSRADGHDSRRGNRRGGYRLRHRHQPETAGSDRGLSKFRFADLHHRGAARRGLPNRGQARPRRV